MSEQLARRIQPRLDLPEADFVALKVRAAERGLPLRDLLAEAVVAWLDSGAPPAAVPPLTNPVVRTHVSLPEPVHRRLKVRAAVERTTMQALVRSALAPLLAEGAPPVCRVVAVVNPRPGAGRTALVFGLGRALAAAGQRTLLVDLDPTAGLTRAAGLDPATLAPTIADLLAPETGEPPRLAEVRRPLDERLGLLPAGPALARAELALLLAGGRERALAELLRPGLAELDQVLIDCPPTLGLLTLLALVAADQSLIPITPSAGADPRELGGLVAALERLRRSRRAPRLGPPAVIALAGSGKTAALVGLVQGLTTDPAAQVVLGEAPDGAAGATAERQYATLAARLLAGAPLVADPAP